MRLLLEMRLRNLNCNDHWIHMPQNAMQMQLLCKCITNEITFAFTNEISSAFIVTDKITFAFTVANCIFNCYYSYELCIFVCRQVKKSVIWSNVLTRSAIGRLMENGAGFRKDDDGMKSVSKRTTHKIYESIQRC